jgi:hypothetical protein
MEGVLLGVVFALTPAELFLFLRDTELLKRLITQERLHFSGVTDVNDPTKKLLRAQGGGDKLVILTAALETLRQVSRLCENYVIDGLMGT